MQLSTTTDSPRASSESEPPLGAPWDLPLERAPLTLLDLEMTGLDPDKDAIVEVALVRLEGGRVVDELSTLVTADVPSRAAALAVHGITAEALVGAPRFEAIAARVLALLSGSVPIAHGPELDVAFLSRALRATGLDPAPLAFVLDTIVLARRAVAASSYTLATLSRTLGLPARRWHRAREDVAGLEALLPPLVRELAPTSPRDLWEVRVGQRDAVRVRRSIAAALDARFASGAPCTLVARTPGRTPFAITGVIEAWSSPHLRVRTLGRRPGMRMLRADRILRIEPPAG